MDLLFKKRLDANLALSVINSKLKNVQKINFRNINVLKKLKKKIPLLIGGAPSFESQEKTFY